MRRTALVLSIVASLAALVIACEEEQAAPEIDTTPIVGVMEVPIALRNDGPAPSDALRIEANQRELRVESQPIYQLDRGTIPEAEVTAEGPTKLRTAIQSAPARSRAALTFHGMVGYGTLARTMQALAGAGYREFAIAVRPVSTTGAIPTSTSWLAISQPQFVPPGGTTVDPAAYGGGNRPWSDFQPHWETAYEACRAGRYIDCDPAPLAFAEGGFLQVVLWARGQGMVVRFNRVGGDPIPDPAEQAARGPALIEGVRAEAPGAGEEVPPTPDAQGVFSFRAEVATAAESPITGVVRPVCGAEVCQTVVEADETTPVMRVISLLGAAFPNGSTAPQLIFRLPE